MDEINRRRRGHQFYPTKAQMPPELYSTEGTPTEDKIVYVHYFSPAGDWYITELDSQSTEAFGYARFASMPECAEWGYIDLGALEEVYRAPFMIVERDMHWTPKKFSEIRGL